MSIYTEEELTEAIQRAVKSDCDFIIMDSNTACNQFLAEGWNLAIQKGWLRVVDYAPFDDQCGDMKGYFTPEAIFELG